MKIGNKIFELRKKKKFSQEELALKIGVTRQTISNWELGETVPNSEQIVLLSKALDISLDELLNNKINISDKRTKTLYIILIGIIFILVVLIIIIIKSNNDEKDYIKLYKKTTTNLNTTTSSQLPVTLKDTFIRTYEIINLEKVICNGDIYGCYDESYNITLKQYDGEMESFELVFFDIENINELEINKNYEFEFRSMGEKYFEDNIINIFANCKIISINETDKVGNEQIQDNIKY